AQRMPVPVAENQLSLKMASSGLVGLPGVGNSTTGLVRRIRLWRPQTGNSGAVTPGRNFAPPVMSGMVSLRAAAVSFAVFLPSRRFFNCGVPQRKTRTLRRIHGTQARRTLGIGD